MIEEKKILKLKDLDILNYHVLESMIDWVRVFDKTGQVIYANKSMKNDLDRVIVGEPCDLACDSGHCQYCVVKNSIVLQKSLQKEENIIGNIYSVKSSPIINNNGNILGAVEVFRDITREKTLEKKLLKSNKKLNEDLILARNVQEAILPKAGKYGPVEIDYIYRPSEILSGDMFDVFYLDEKNIGIYISDVVGHGLPASMVTMFVRQCMRFIKDDKLRPAEALEELDKRYKSLDYGYDKYLTIFYGVFNTETYEFKYANGGHNSVPIVIRDGNFIELKVAGYPITRVFENLNYKEETIKLEKNDKVLFYTDGILETRNLEGIEFGVEGIKKALLKSPDKSLVDIQSALDEYKVKAVEDDFALVMMEL